MKYIMLIYGSEADFASLSPEAMAQEYAKYNAFAGTMVERGLTFSGAELDFTGKAKTVRLREGQTVATDGPFAETHEQLGGFYIFDCQDMNEAVEIAAHIPAAAHGSIEVRPLMEFSQ